MSENNNLIRARGKAALFPIALVAPAWIVLIVFTLYPLVMGVSEAFQWHNLYMPWKTGFAGLAHFQRAFSDPLFYFSLKNTLLWVVASTVSQLILGFGAALLLNQKFRLRGLARAAALSPWAVSGVLTGLMWVYMFHGQVGIINDILMKLGIITYPIPWMSQLSTSLPSTIFANTWAGMTFFVIAMLSALQMIPDDLYEAASIDGANRWRQFRHITLPLLTPVIFLALVIAVINSFQVFTSAWVLTQGGPYYATTTILLHLYNQGFGQFKMGYASAMAMVLFAIVFVVTVLQSRMQKEWVHYE